MTNGEPAIMQRYLDERCFPRNFEYQILKKLRNDSRCSKYDAMYNGIRVILYVGYRKFLISPWDYQGNFSDTPTEVVMLADLNEIEHIPSVVNCGTIKESDAVYYSIRSDECVPVYQFLTSASSWSRIQCFQQTFHCVYRAATEKGIYHGCISPDYVIFNQGEYQVTGWQFSKIVPVHQQDDFVPYDRDGPFRVWTTSTPMAYCAPETMYCKFERNASHRPEMQLVWNLGVFLFYLHFNSLPYNVMEITTFADFVWKKKDVICALDQANQMENHLFEKISGLDANVRNLIWSSLTLMEERRICLDYMKACVQELQQ